MRPLKQNRFFPTYSRRDALRLLGLAGVTAAFAPRLIGASEVSPAMGGSSPTLAGAQPGFYRFRIGSFEALALNDGGMATTTNESPFGVGEPKEKVIATLKDSFLPTDKVHIPFNVLVVRIGSELVMIDSGCGSVFGPAGGKLVSNLAAAGVKPEQISAVILSHVHGDHFGGLLDANKEPVFKNAKLFIQRQEHAFWTGSAPDLSAMKLSEESKKGFITSAQTYLTAFKGKWQFISGGDKLLDGIEVIDAVGHTPGHIGLLFSSGSEQLLHFVDAAHNHAISFAHPEWIMAFDAQPQVAIETRKKLFDRAAADRLRVFGAHMPFPALGHVRSTEGHYEFVIEAPPAV
jgi:glyoxylase-like metal-dependent hydrolase (beta-lactamase superfamily II)